MQKVLVGVAGLAIMAGVALGARQGMLVRPQKGAPPAAATPPAVRWHARQGTPGARTASAHPEPARAASGATMPSPSTSATSTASATPAADPPAAPGPAAGQQSAAAILRRAAAAYRGVHSLRAGFVQVVRNPLLGGAITSRGTLYQRRPDRFLMKFSDPAGDLLVSDGRWFWIYYPSVDPKQVIRTPASAAGQAVDLQAQFLGDPERRFTSRLEGRESVAGRQAYVLSLTPKGSEPFKAIKLWLDPADYLARRFEITEQNGNVRHIDLSDLRVNVPAGDALFRFTPPAGAHIVTRG